MTPDIEGNPPFFYMNMNDFVFIYIIIKQIKDCSREEMTHHHYHRHAIAISLMQELD